MTTELMAQGIAYIEKDGQILFSAEEIGKQLGYQNPRQSITVLFNRNVQELLAYSTNINLISVDRKNRNIRHFTEEGVYILSMLANTDKARDFRKRVAELLKNLRKKQLEQVRNQAYSDAKKFLMNQVTEIEAEAFERGVRSQKSHDGWIKMQKAADYLEKGLPLTDTAKLVGLHPDTIRKRFRKLSVWEQIKNGDFQFSKNNKVCTQIQEPVQGSLLQEVRHVHARNHFRQRGPLRSPEQH